jgi:hypothetical protein
MRNNSATLSAQRSFDLLQNKSIMKPIHNTVSWSANVKENLPIPFCLSPLSIPYFANAATIWRGERKCFHFVMFTGS